MLLDMERRYLNLTSRKFIESPTLDSDFRRINETRKNARSLGNNIPVMMLLGVVSSFEHTIGSLISKLLIHRPEVLSSKNIELTLKDISSFGTVDEIKKHYVDHQVESVMRESLEKQVDAFERYLGIKKPIKKDYGKWAELVEIFERRNLFAHNKGVVNNIYLSKVEEKISSEIGTRLKVDVKYFSESIKNMFEFGVKLIIVAWKRQLPDSLGKIDDLIGNFCFDLIVSRQFELAKELLAFCDSYAIPATELRRRMNAVNHANCLRLLGDEGGQGQYCPV